MFLKVKKLKMLENKTKKLDQKLNVPREQQQQQHSNPSHDHAAKAAGKKYAL